MVHEFWPHRVLTVDQLPSGSRVPSLCQPVPGRSPSAGVLVFGSVSDDGLRSADLPRELAGHRSVPSFAARQILPHGIPQPRGTLDAGRRQRVARLAHLRGLCRGIDRHRAAVICPRPDRRRFGSQSVRAGLDHHRPLPLAGSVGAVPPTQSRCQDAHAAGPARQHPHVYPHYRRQSARRQHPRRNSARGRAPST